MQTRSVQDYITWFQILDLPTSDMSAEEQLHKFTAGLKPAIREEVEIEGCSTLAETMRVAHRQHSPLPLAANQHMINIIRSNVISISYIKCWPLANRPGCHAPGKHLEQLASNHCVC